MGYTDLRLRHGPGEQGEMLWPMFGDTCPGNDTDGVSALSHLSLQSPAFLGYKVSFIGFCRHNKRHSKLVVMSVLARKEFTIFSHIRCDQVPFLAAQTPGWNQSHHVRRVQEQKVGG